MIELKSSQMITPFHILYKPIIFMQIVLSYKIPILLPNTLWQNKYLFPVQYTISHIVVFRSRFSISALYISQKSFKVMVGSEVCCNMKCAYHSSASFFVLNPRFWDFFLVPVQSVHRYWICHVPFGSRFALQLIRSPPWLRRTISHENTPPEFCLRL